MKDLVTAGTSKTMPSQAVKTDLPRPLEDPGDTTDDNTGHPDKPTEPPDDIESVRGGKKRVEAKVLRALRGRANMTIESGGDMGAQTESGGDEDIPEDLGGGMTCHDDVERVVSPDGEPQHYMDTISGLDGETEGVEG